MHTMLFNWFRHDYTVQYTVQLWIIWIWLYKEWWPVEFHSSIVVLHTQTIPLASQFQWPTTCLPQLLYIATIFQFHISKHVTLYWCFKTRTEPNDSVDWTLNRSLLWFGYLSGSITVVESWPWDLTDSKWSSVFQKWFIDQTNINNHQLVHQLWSNSNTDQVLYFHSFLTLVCHH